MLAGIVVDDFFFIFFGHIRNTLKLLLAVVFKFLAPIKQMFPLFCRHMRSLPYVHRFYYLWPVFNWYMHTKTHPACFKVPEKMN
jgi:hypothetical protein